MQTFNNKENSLIFYMMYKTRFVEGIPIYSKLKSTSSSYTAVFGNLRSKAMYVQKSNGVIVKMRTYK